MAKRSNVLTIVAERSATYHAPPSSLGETGRTLWNRVLTDYEIADIAGLVTLEQACAAADRAEMLRRQIERDGQMIQTAQGPREHPCLKHEIAARGLLLRALGRLGLNFEPLKPVGRPPIGVGWKGWKP
jgi:hypothetical protein